MTQNEGFGPVCPLNVCVLQRSDSPEPVPKMKRSFYAARDLYKYRHSYPVKQQHYIQYLQFIMSLFDVYLL